MSNVDRLTENFEKIVLYINLFKPDSVKVSQVGYLFDIKIVYLCEMA